jgi:hypothetical protein
MFLFLIDIFFQNFKVTFGTIEELCTDYSIRHQHFHSASRREIGGIP